MQAVEKLNYVKIDRANQKAVKNHIKHVFVHLKKVKTRPLLTAYYNWYHAHPEFQDDSFAEFDKNIRENHEDLAKSESDKRADNVFGDKYAIILTQFIMSYSLFQNELIKIANNLADLSKFEGRGNLGFSKILTSTDILMLKDIFNLLRSKVGTVVVLETRAEMRERMKQMLEDDDEQPVRNGKSSFKYVPIKDEKTGDFDFKKEKKQAKKIIDKFEDEEEQIETMVVRGDEKKPRGEVSRKSSISRKSSLKRNVSFKGKSDEQVDNSFQNDFNNDFNTDFNDDFSHLDNDNEFHDCLDNEPEETQIEKFTHGAYDKFKKHLVTASCKSHSESSIIDVEYDLEKYKNSFDDVEITKIVNTFGDLNNEMERLSTHFEKLKFAGSRLNSLFKKPDNRLQ